MMEALGLFENGCPVQPEHPQHRLSTHPLGIRFAFREGPEKGDELPDGTDTHQDVDDARQKGVLAAEKCCNKVKLEQANQTPVQAADNHKQQRDDVYGAHLRLLRKRLHGSQTGAIKVGSGIIGSDAAHQMQNPELDYRKATKARPALMEA